MTAAITLTLKNVRANAKLSEETTCFSATLYADGRKVAEVGKRGEGGPNFYHWAKPADAVTVAGYAAGLPRYAEYAPESLDVLVGDLLTRAEDLKWLAHHTKAKTLFMLEESKPGNWHTVAAPYTPAVKAFIHRKYAGKVKCIANDDIDAAVEFV